MELSVSAQLQALVFTKSLTMKDIKGTTTTEKEKGSKAEKATESTEEDELPVQSETTPLLPEGGAKIAIESAESIKSSKEAAKNAGESKKLEEPETKSKEVITLMAVDVMRVSAFCAEQWLILASTLNFVFALTFLVRILGWWR